MIRTNNENSMSRCFNEIARNGINPIGNKRNGSFIVSQFMPSVRLSEFNKEMNTCKKTSEGSHH